jgi:opacity protein-like surface antigen
MKTVTRTAIVTAVLACTPLAVTPAYAVEGSTYLGGGVGYSRLNGEDFTNTNGDLSDNQGSWKAVVGIKFSPMLSAEGQFIDFGAANRASDRVQATAWTAGAVLNLLGDSAISPYGKIGGVFWSTDNRFNNLSVNESGTDLALGLGVRFTFGGKLSLRTEYERFEMDATQVDNVSAALLFNF